MSDFIKTIVPMTDRKGCIEQSDIAASRILSKVFEGLVLENSCRVLGFRSNRMGHIH